MSQNKDFTKQFQDHLVQIINHAKLIDTDNKSNSFKHNQEKSCVYLFLKSNPEKSAAFKFFNHFLNTNNIKIETKIEKESGNWKLRFDLRNAELSHGAQFDAAFTNVSFSDHSVESHQKAASNPVAAPKPAASAATPQQYAPIAGFNPALSPLNVGKAKPASAPAAAVKPTVKPAAAPAQPVPVPFQNPPAFAPGNEPDIAPSAPGLQTIRQVIPVGKADQKAVPAPTPQTGWITDSRKQNLAKLFGLEELHANGAGPVSLKDSIPGNKCAFTYTYPVTIGEPKLTILREFKTGIQQLGVEILNRDGYKSRYGSYNPDSNDNHLTNPIFVLDKSKIDQFDAILTVALMDLEGLQHQPKAAPAPAAQNSAAYHDDKDNARAGRWVQEVGRPNQAPPAPQSLTARNSPPGGLSLPDQESTIRR